jgi:hypothetical protein
MFSIIFNLKNTYLFGALMFLCTLIFPPYQKLRFVLLSLAFVPLTLSHFIIYFSEYKKGIKLNFGFAIIGVLWLFKVTVFTIDEIRVIFLGTESLNYLEWMDVFALNLNLILIFLTITFKYPLFCKVVENNVYIYIGITGLLISIWSLIQVIFLYINSLGLL